MASQEFVIATFNTEWRKPASDDAKLIRERLDAADIVCLTEAYRDFFGDQGFLLEPPFLGEGRDDGRRKVLLWSKRPWTSAKIGKGSLPSHYLAGTTKTAAGPIKVYGIVIPYRFCDVRYGKPKRKVWEMHQAFLDNLDELLPPVPQRSIILGDFNQRSPAKYQPQSVTEQLQRVILRRFELATGDIIPGMDKQAIDHICQTSDLRLARVEALSNSRKDGRQVSDHFGLQATYSS